jgi:hypothetical protein
MLLNLLNAKLMTGSSHILSLASQKVCARLFAMLEKAKPSKPDMGLFNTCGLTAFTFAKRC